MFTEEIRIQLMVLTALILIFYVGMQLPLLRAVALSVGIHYLVIFLLGQHLEASKLTQSKITINNTNYKFVTDKEGKITDVSHTDD